MATVRWLLRPGLHPAGDQRAPGHLYALIENEFDYRLIPVSRNVFVCPPGMYAEEQLVFLTSADEKVQGVTLANMHLPRR